jgi:hypothetical protein
MNQSRLRNNNLSKFKTAGKLPIVLRGIHKKKSIQKYFRLIEEKPNEKLQHVTGWTWKHKDLDCVRKIYGKYLGSLEEKPKDFNVDRLCQKFSPEIGMIFWNGEW